MEKVYLDNAATTPVHPEVLRAMEPYFSRQFGNPSSIYTLASNSKDALDRARERVAKLINASFDEIIFTGGGSEADNLAIKGIAFSQMDKGRHIISSAIEHHAVLHTCQFLEEKMGFHITYLPVDQDGLVNPQDLMKSITPETILVTIMLANNEIGTIEPIKELSFITQERGIPFHVDAVQAVGSIPVDVKDLGIQLLSLSGHKFNGPKGVGALYCKGGVRLAPLIHGGAQEGGLRAGTENVPAIVGLGEAAFIAQRDLPMKKGRMARLREQMIAGIENRIDEVLLNGHRSLCLPGLVNYSFRYVEGESLLMKLHQKGIAVSSGSACTSGSLSPSHVLMAIGLSHEVAHGSLRFSLGNINREADVDYLLEVLPEVVMTLREMSPLYK